jgi:hypothetical protein
MFLEAYGSARFCDMVDGHAVVGKPSSTINSMARMANEPRGRQQICAIMILEVPGI